jgi:hypothetical protein
MKTREFEQVKEALKNVATAEEIAEISVILEEAKGRILQLEPSLGFWEGKTPCWEMFRCPQEVRNECPSFKYRSLPCWEIEGTYCKLFDYGAKGDGTKRWGHSEPIKIKLLGKGLSTIG